MVTDRSAKTAKLFHLEQFAICGNLQWVFKVSVLCWRDCIRTRILYNCSYILYVNSWTSDTFGVDLHNLSIVCNYINVCPLLFKCQSSAKTLSEQMISCCVYTVANVLICTVEYVYIVKFMECNSIPRQGKRK